MSGIFPNVIDGAVPPTSATNGYTPAVAPTNTAALFYGNNCNLKIRADVINALISEFLCTVSSAGLSYDAANLCNLNEAINKKIAEAIATVPSTPVVRATCSDLAPSGASAGDYWMDTNSNPLQLYKRVGAAWSAQAIASAPTIVVCKNCLVGQMFLNCGTGYVQITNDGSGGVGGTNSQAFSVPTTGIPFVVPIGVTSLTVENWGAGGGAGGALAAFAFVGGDGGTAGYVKGTIAVTPGETLIVKVGGGGKGGGTSGGAVTNFGGGGGGYSGIFRGGVPLLIAPGGGGGGGARNGGTGTFNGAKGGAGGGPIGQSGVGGPGGQSNPGLGGTQTAGGAGGYNGGTDGAAYLGGNGGHGPTVANSNGINGGGLAGTPGNGRGSGGGGGGGRFGGGGGSNGYDNPDDSGAGAGGGSNYIIPSATTVTDQPGGFTNPGGTGSLNYVSGLGAAGIGGNPNGTNGGDGKVFIQW